MSFDTIPKDLRGLRACLVCSLIKVSTEITIPWLHNANEIIDFQTVEQFEFDGCDNCESFLRMKKNKDRVMDVTSNNFDGWENNQMTSLRVFNKSGLFLEWSQ